RPVAGVDLNRVVVGGAGRAVVQAQALVAGDGTARRAGPAAATAPGDLVEDRGVLVAVRLVVAVDLPEGQLADAVAGGEALQGRGVGGGEELVVVVLAGDGGQAHHPVGGRGRDPVQAGELGVGPRGGGLGVVQRVLAVAEVHRH